MRDFCVFISVELIWIYAISCLRRFENGRFSDISRDPSPVPGSFSSCYFHFHLLFIFIFLRSTRGRSPMVCRNVPFLHVAAFRGVGRSQTDQSLSLCQHRRSKPASDAGPGASRRCSQATRRPPRPAPRPASLLCRSPALAGSPTDAYAAAGGGTPSQRAPWSLLARGAVQLAVQLAVRLAIEHRAP